MNNEAKSKTYIAVGPFCWGKASTQYEAVVNAKKNLPGPPYVNDKAKVEFHVYDCHVETVVTDLGGFRYPKGQQPKLVSKFKLRGNKPYPIEVRST